MTRARFISEVALLGLIIAFAVWLALDARRASLDLENLVLIVPAAVLTVGTAGWLAVAAVLRQEPTGTAAAPSGGYAMKVAGLLLLLVLLVAGLEVVGFDGTSFLFLLGGAWLLGERRPLPLILFAAVFACLVVMALQAILPFPMPTLLL
jgi:hypothetical protein